MHGHTDQWASQAPLEVMRFYFLDEADTAAFKKRWRGKE